jgi:hypothetical protein
MRVFGSIVAGAGTLELRGDFLESSPVPAAVALDAVSVLLSGSRAQTIRFDHAGASGSRFGSVTITNTNTSFGVSFESNVVAGTLDQRGLLRVRFGRTLDVATLRLYSGSATAVDAGATINAATCRFGPTATVTPPVAGCVPDPAL